jgi:type VI secretion system protein ImpA
MLCCSLLKTGGIAGFRDGVQLIGGLLSRYWAGLYPLLDPEDNNDPTQRLNILLALTAPRGSVAGYGGWLAIVDYLYAAPVCQPKGAPPVTFEQIVAAGPKATGSEQAPADAFDPAKLSAAIRSAGDQAAAVQQALQQAAEALRDIDQFLTTTLGAGNTISFEVLDNALQEMLTALNSHLTGGAAESILVSAAAAGSRAVSVGGGANAITVSGPICSRDDVVRALESICDYYRQVEPCNPVPYLLRRAQKLARMNFVEAVQELNLATVDSLRPSMGSAVDTSAPPSQTPAA